MAEAKIALNARLTVCTAAAYPAAGTLRPVPAKHTMKNKQTQGLDDLEGAPPPGAVRVKAVNCFSSGPGAVGTLLRVFTLGRRQRFL